MQCLKTAWGLSNLAECLDYVKQGMRDAGWDCTVLGRAAGGRVPLCQAAGVIRRFGKAACKCFSEENG